MGQDLRYAVRSLVSTPGFTAVTVLTLALGIGANTAVFSVVNAVLLKPLPFPRPAELVALYETLPGRAGEPANSRMAVTPATTRDWAGAPGFTSLAFYAVSDFILTGAGEPERIAGANVSWTFFDTLGAQPMTGRLLTRDDDLAGAPLVAVIGEDLWRSRFGRSPAIVGQAIELSGRRHTVVGITPSSSAFPSNAQIWAPLALPEDEFADAQRLSFYLRGIGRLGRDITPARAEAELDTIAARLAARLPDPYEGRGAAVVPLHTSIVGEVRPAMLLLFGAAGCVLLIACVNVANLMLARGSGRRGETAIRAALGASPWRLVRERLTESLVLSSLGAGFGLLLALWTRDAIVALTPAGVPRISEARLDVWVLGFTVALTLAAAVAFGLAPALISSRRAVVPSLAGTRRGVTHSGSARLRSALVVAELALSLALLTGAGLLGRTFWQLMRVDPGFEPSGVMTMEVVLPRAKYPASAQRAAFFERVTELLDANPLVASVGGVTHLPLSNTQMTYGFHREGMTPGTDAPSVANVRAVTPGYFRTLDIPQLRGRDFGRSEREGSAPVVIINDAMRRTFWPDVDPLGRRISITRGHDVVWREIVGVVGDIRHSGLDTQPQPEIYIPYAHDPFFFLRIAVRSASEPAVLAGSMRAAVWAVDPTQPVSRVRPMEDVVASSVADRRFNAVMIGTFSVLALALAAVGLYGIISYAVTLRLHEFGVRMVLGGDRRHLLALVLRQAVPVAVVGLALGLMLAALLTRLIETQLYQTSRLDPVTLAGVCMVLIVVTIVASCVPARRALAVDAAVALRAE